MVRSRLAPTDQSPPESPVFSTHLKYRKGLRASRANVDGLAVVGDGDGLRVPLPVELGAQDDPPAPGRVAHPDLALQECLGSVHRWPSGAPLFEVGWNCGV